MVAAADTVTVRPPLTSREGMWGVGRAQRHAQTTRDTASAHYA